MAQESAKNMHMVISRALQRHPKIDRVMYMPHSPRLSFETIGWNSRNVELYTTLLLNLLGGRSGDLKLKKKGVLIKPPWFSDKVDWRKFIAPSKATYDDNLDIIKGIFNFYNLDMKVHNDHPVAGD